MIVPGRGELRARPDRSFFVSKRKDDLIRRITEKDETILDETRQDLRYLLENGPEKLNTNDRVDPPSAK